MKLLYVKEHLLCENYERGKKPTFENFYLPKGGVFNKYIEEAEILFVMKGSLTLTYNRKESPQKVDDIILLPSASNLGIVAKEDIHIIVLRIRTAIHLCNIQPLEKLFDKGYIGKNESIHLRANDRIKQFLNLLHVCLEDGLRCKCFIDIKAKEIFYYFRAYYTKESLRDFFSPLLTKDYKFKVFVFQNYRKVKTVQQFANIYGFSLSCFEKQFKKTFNISAYQWMTEQKAQSIYLDLVNTETTLIELADEYGFSSLSQFCDFCKRVFGTSPGKIRNEKKCLNNFPTIMNK